MKKLLVLIMLLAMTASAGAATATLDIVGGAQAQYDKDDTITIEIVADIAVGKMGADCITFGGTITDAEVAGMVTSTWMNPSF
jgi:hypothetical protein